MEMKMPNSILEQIQQKLGWYAKGVEELGYPSSADNTNFIASDAVKKIMKYHGVEGLHPGSKPNEYFFMRDGKKVKVALPRELRVPQTDVPYEGGFF